MSLSQSSLPSSGLPSKFPSGAPGVLPRNEPVHLPNASSTESMSVPSESVDDLIDGPLKSKTLQFLYLGYQGCLRDVFREWTEDPKSVLKALGGGAEAQSGSKGVSESGEVSEGGEGDSMDLDHEKVRSEIVSLFQNWIRETILDLQAGFVEKCVELKLDEKLVESERKRGLKRLGIDEKILDAQRFVLELEARTKSDYLEELSATHAHLLKTNEILSQEVKRKRQSVARSLSQNKTKKRTRDAPPPSQIPLPKRYAVLHPTDSSQASDHSEPAHASDHTEPARASDHSEPAHASGQPQSQSQGRQTFPDGAQSRGATQPVPVQRVLAQPVLTQPVLTSTQPVVFGKPSAPNSAQPESHSVAQSHSQSQSLSQTRPQPQVVYGKPSSSA